MLVELDEGTVSAAVNGDAEALSRLLERCQDPLRAHFADRIGRRYRAALDVEDVLQVTYMEAFLHAGRFVWNGTGSFYAWLCQIGENNLRDAIRELDAEKRPSRRRQIVTEPTGDRYTTFLATLSATGTTPTQQARREEAKEILSRAMADLPPDYARAVQFYDLEGRNIDEVARSFDPPRSRGAIHMLRARAIDCLRELLGQPERFLSSDS